MAKTLQIKKKCTHYFTEEAQKQLRELYFFKYMTKKTMPGKDTEGYVTRSDIVCQAIGLLFKKELGSLEKKHKDKK